MESEHKPNYFAIIPANVRYDKRLKANEKLLYGEITALASAKGVCWASNQYFARLYDVAPETISRWISNLQKHNYIAVQVEYNQHTQQVINRAIFINHHLDKKINTLDEKVNGVLTKRSRGYCQKDQEGIDEKIKENNTSINNTSINNIDIVELAHSEQKSESIPYKKVVDYLNKKTGKKYRSTTDKTQKLIRARWHEGFRTDDFKKVIDTKVKEWSNDAKMNNFLRPETLFGTKFESYLNQSPVQHWGGEYDDLGF